MSDIKTIKKYRMEVSATICFSVAAFSDDEATELANKAVLELDNEGFDIGDGENYEDARAYVSSEDTAEIVDVEEES